MPSAGEKPVSQLFRSMVSREAWIHLLDRIARKEDNQWIVCQDVFRRGMYHGIIPTFVETELAPCYHAQHRQKYVESRELTYSLFLTMMRQLCRMHGYSFTAQTVYDRSKPLCVLRIAPS